MSTLEFLSSELIEKLHNQQIKSKGGSPGVKDYGLLDSATNAPINRLNYKEPIPDLVELAATYMYHLAKNHAFNDGNKRIALVATYTFLKGNGLILDVDPEKILEDFIISFIEDKNSTVESVADFLSQYVS